MDTYHRLRSILRHAGHLVWSGHQQLADRVSEHWPFPDCQPRFYMSLRSGRRAPFILAFVIVAVGSFLCLRSKSGTPAPIPANAPDANVPGSAAGPVTIKAAGSASNSLSVPAETPPAPPEFASPVTNPPLTLDPALVYSPTAVPDISPEVILGNMRNAIRLYSSMFGENPVGNNAEITRALNGENPKQTQF